MDDLFDSSNIEVTMPADGLVGNAAKITVIGVGGGGCNMINHMIKEGTHRINLIAANTDLQVLQTSKAPKTIQLGTELTKGLGAGANPQIGKDSALESYEEIKEALSSADIVFVAAGLGGGTGTGAAPIIAKAAKEVGALTVCVVTKPFTIIEGRKRSGLANIGLEELKRVSDSIIVISNDKLISVIDKDTGIKDAFKIVDNVLYQAVNGMSEVILNHGDGDINTDFADVQTIMKHRGMALMGIGKAKGDNAVMNALHNAVESPLLDKLSLAGAKGMLIHFHIHPEISLFAINDVMTQLHNIVDNNAEVIFGTTTDTTLNNDEVKITIVATGFESQEVDDDKEACDTEPIQPKTVLNPEDDGYYDIPPLMRNYQLKYQL
ncbi:MAG: cell division protein FtsZ [Campylobacterales bacterium]|nr:cell division protein FtsZ [Campylobacterales bacterium]